MRKGCLSALWYEDQSEVLWRRRSSSEVETWASPRRRTNSVHEASRLEREMLCSGAVSVERVCVEVMGWLMKDWLPR